MGTEPVIIGPATLYQSDCLEVLRRLEVGIATAFVTSPPYNQMSAIPEKPSGAWADSRGGAGFVRFWNEAGYADEMPEPAYQDWQNEVFAECSRVGSDDASAFYNRQRAGGINFSPAFYLPTHEWVVVLAQADWRLKSKGASGVGDVWYIPQESNPDHPAPFPLELPARILETTTGAVVLDPFMGSGTTAVACIQAEREFIGIELDAGYFAKACKRIQRAWDAKQRELPFERPEVVQAELFG